MTNKLTIALPKGRLAELSAEYLEERGIYVSAMKEKTRKLIFQSDCKRYEIILVRASDVTAYVERGAADLGVVGKDLLLEYSPEVYELKDLEFGYCRMCIAKEKDENINLNFKNWDNLKVATKFVNIAKKHFTQKGINAEIIKLYGSIEIAPLLDLSDVIVDIVSTGKTLKENNLEEVETLFESTARLIANKVSFKKNQNEIKEILK
ncbi:MAG: ATP phosphoribosyltransferase [Fusobacteriota bacterium]